MSLKLQDLELSFGEKKILHSINLEVSGGELVAVLGTSGSGKSTLLRILAGLIQPTAGVLEAHSRKVAFVFQEPRLLPWLPAWKNVVLGLNSPYSKALQQKALAALNEVGLGHAAELLPKELSGGMAQRVALARALVTQPELLLLDEPFSAVDALTRLQLHEHLLRLWNKHSFAAILVTHDVDEALLLADRVVVLAGTPATVVFEAAVGPRPRNRHDHALTNLREDLLLALSTGRPQPDAQPQLGLSGLAM